MSNERADRATAASSSIAVVAAGACIACTLLLIASTIVLALIPVFLVHKEVTVNPNALKSKTAEAYLGVQGNIGSRKRAINASGSIDQLDGAYLDSTSIVILQTLFMKYLPTKIVDSITLPNVTFGRNPVQYSIPSQNNYPYAFHVFFVILFKSNCLYACQQNNVATLKSQLESVNSTSGTLGQLTFWKDGIRFGTLTITTFAMGYVETIVPGTSSVDITDISTVASMTTTTSNSTGNGTNSGSSG